MGDYVELHAVHLGDEIPHVSRCGGGGPDDVRLAVGALAEMIPESPRE